MTDCRLTISSRGSGWKSDICERAAMEISQDGARIEYLVDGDRCTLVLMRDFAEQTRRGKADIKMTFRPSQPTACIIGDSALKGGFRIYCTHYKFISGSMGADAKIEYLSGDDNEKVCVKIRAIRIVGD